MKNKLNLSPKALAALLAVTLMLGGVVGGTIAWLKTETSPIVNTFTVGDIDITLEETWNTDSDSDGTADKWEGKILPGSELAKDPVVTVKANSEACWLFVELTKSSNWPSAMTYQIVEDWTELPNVSENSTIYYRQVGANENDQSFHILLGDKVEVADTMTKADLNLISGTPTLTIKAYAIQAANIGEDADAAKAWELIDQQ